LLVAILVSSCDFTDSNSNSTPEDISGYYYSGFQSVERKYTIYYAWGPGDSREDKVTEYTISPTWQWKVTVHQYGDYLKLFLIPLGFEDQSSVTLEGDGAGSSWDRKWALRVSPSRHCRHALCVTNSYWSGDYDSETGEFVVSNTQHYESSIPPRQLQIEGRVRGNKLDLTVVGDVNLGYAEFRERHFITADPSEESYWEGAHIFPEFIGDISLTLNKR